MTTRRINWTSRKRLERARVAISLVPKAEGTAFTAGFKLDDLGLPGDAQVAIEAYRQTSLMRFDFGTVGYVRPPASTLLTEFDPVNGVLFRVKVLSTEGSSGRILAEADGLHPVNPGDADAGREPLLIPQGEDLGEELWQLVTGDTTERPVLLVNNRMGDWKGLAKSPHFLWLVYPEVLRRILWWALEDGVPADDDETDWRGHWIRFTERLPGMTSLGNNPGKEDLTSWVDGAVQCFCRVHRFRGRFESLLFETAE